MDVLKGVLNVLYGQKMKEILSKFGIDTSTLPNNLYSTLLDEISKCDGSSASVDYDAENMQITIGGVLYDLKEHKDGIKLIDGTIIPLLAENEMNRYWFIMKDPSDGKSTKAYVCDRGYGVYDGQCYPIDKNNTLLNSDYSTYCTVYKLIDGEWIKQSNAYYTRSEYIKATNTNIYKWSNLATKTTTISVAKNN